MTADPSPVTPSLMSHDIDESPHTPVADDPQSDDVKPKTLGSTRRGKQYKCGHCHGLGHNQKTCPRRTSSANDQTNIQPALVDAAELFASTNVGLSSAGNGHASSPTQPSSSIAACGSNGNNGGNNGLGTTDGTSIPGAEVVEIQHHHQHDQHHHQHDQHDQHQHQHDQHQHQHDQHDQQQHDQHQHQHGQHQHGQHQHGQHQHGQHQHDQHQHDQHQHGQHQHGQNQHGQHQHQHQHDQQQQTQPSIPRVEPCKFEMSLDTAYKKVIAADKQIGDATTEAEFGKGISTLKLAVYNLETITECLEKVTRCARKRVYLSRTLSRLNDRNCGDATTDDDERDAKRLKYDHAHHAHHPSSSLPLNDTAVVAAASLDDRGHQPGRMPVD